MKRYLYVEEPEGEFCQLNMTLDEFYHTSHKIDNQQKEIARLNKIIDKYDKELTHKTEQYEFLRHSESKEIKRLQSNCKTLAKMLDKEIEKNNRAIEELDYLISNCDISDYQGEKIKNILKEEYNVGEVK